MSEGPWEDYAQPAQESGPWDSYANGQEKGQSPTAPYTGPNPTLAPEEEVRNEPGLQDVSASDAMTAQGVAGLGKLGAGLAGKGVGALLEKGIPALSEANLGGAEAVIPNTKNVIPSIERVANNQTLKSMGGTMGQLGQMEKGRGGREALDQAAQFARDKGLTDVFSTSIGREEALKNLLKESGEKVGALRVEAGAAPKDIISKVVGSPEIDKYLGRGSASGELGGVDKALADIQEVGGENPTHASLADAATYINKNAAGNKLYQPVNAETDVANILSRENNAGIAQTLGSDKAKQYVEALSEQEKLHPLEHLQKRGEIREAGGRSLPMNIIQGIADKMGYRMTAKTAAMLADILKGKTLGGAASEAVAPTARLGNFSASKAVPAAIAQWIKKQKGEVP